MNLDNYQTRWRTGNWMTTAQSLTIPSTINHACSKTTIPKTLYKEDKCEADPTYQASSWTTCKESNQGGHVWGQTLLATPTLPLPTSWGWMKIEDGLHKPNWTTLPEASKACYMSCYHVSAKRVVWDVANARRLHLSAQLCMPMKESVNKLGGVLNNLHGVYNYMYIYVSETTRFFYKINHKELCS